MENKTKRTSILVGFRVNDLSASYKAVVSSKDYSFTHDFGIGDNLVDEVGDDFSQTLSLDGNYGYFEVRVYAENNIGIKSEYASSNVYISPPTFYGTFSFSSINNNLSSIGGRNNENYVIQEHPADSLTGNQMVVSDTIFEPSVNISWDMSAPEGHPMYGKDLGGAIFIDDFFDKFTIKFLKDDVEIDLNSFADDSDEIIALSRSLNIQPEYVKDKLNNYQELSLTLSDEAYRILGLGRQFSVKITAFDYKGGFCFGIINFESTVPSIDNLTNSVIGNRSTFSWDYRGGTLGNSVDVRIISMPVSAELKHNSDFDVNFDFFSSVSGAKKYKLISGTRYDVGAVVLYQGKIYECISSHVSSISTTPSRDNLVWREVGDDGFYTVQELNVTASSFENYQNWGYKYYYSFQPKDSLGNGIDVAYEEGGYLTASSSSLSLENAVAREDRGDIVFTWDVHDSNGHDVDLNQYKFSIDPKFPPAILGISGHLFDLDAWSDHGEEIIVKSINDGQNSIVSKTSEDGFELSSAPGAGVYYRYDYTLESNRQIYLKNNAGYRNLEKENKLPVIKEEFNELNNYLKGDNVTLIKNQEIWQCYNESNTHEGLYIKPYYDEWNIENEYTEGDCFSYKGSIFKINQNFSLQDSGGVFRYDRDYDIGDYVVASNITVYEFDLSKSYLAGERVTYEGGFYQCIQDQSSGNVESLQNNLYWKSLSEFEDIQCNVYIANESVSQNGSYPNYSSSWEILDVFNSDIFEEVIPGYKLNVSDWSPFENYSTNSLVSYDSKVWRALQDYSGTSVAEAENDFSSLDFELTQWSNADIEGVDLTEGLGYKKGDLVYSNGTVYKCLSDNPLGPPIQMSVEQGLELRELADAYFGENMVSNWVYQSDGGKLSLASLVNNNKYNSSQWQPIWTNISQSRDFIFPSVFGYKPTVEGGRRGIGLSISLLDIDGNPLSSARIIGVNPAPVISNQNFEVEVDSLSLTENVNFKFKYLLGFQERTTFLELYRKKAEEWENDNFSFEIRNENGLVGLNSEYFVKKIDNSTNAEYGQNLVEIEDQPPLNVNEDGKKITTSYVYKLLPYDDFGSGQAHFVSSEQGSRVIVFDKSFSTANENAPNGPIVRASQPIANLGGVPFPVDNLNGSTAFETFLLNWETKDTDIDFFELWQEKSDWNSGALIIQEGESTPEFLSQEKNQEGFRRFAGALYSIGDIAPTEQTEFSVINAEKIFDIPGNTRTVSTSVAGDANSSANFWVRAVDKGGNKGPFTGSFIGDIDANVLGLSLTAGGFNPQSIDGFESSITEKFPKSIALVPDNPFVAGDRNAWSAHKLFWKGGEYNISEYDSKDYGTAYKDGYVYWRTGDNGYSFSEGHPAGDENNSPSSDFEDGDFIVARYKDGNVSTQFVAYNTASIGTANIVDGAITNAKIGSLSADKITAGTIDSQEIEIAGTGAIKSKGFSSNEDDGFSINGDGSFLFQSFSERIDPSTGNVVKEKSRLAFDGGGLFLEGRLQTKSGKNKEIVKGSANTNFIKYYPMIESIPHPYGSTSYTMEEETVFYPFWHHKVTGDTPESGKQSAPDIVVHFEIQNSNLNPEDVRFDVFALNGENSVQIIHDQHYGENGYNQPGFKFDLNNTSGNDIVVNEDTMIVKCTLKGGYVEHHGYWFSYPHERGFDQMIKFAFTEPLPPFSWGTSGNYFAEDKIADSILIRYRSISGASTSDVIIRRSSDSIPGPQGQQGDTGASVDFWFTRSQSFPSAVSSGSSPGNIWYTNFSTLSSTIDKNFINPKNGATYEGSNNELQFNKFNSSHVLNLSDLGLYYNDTPQVTNFGAYTTKDYITPVEPIKAQVGGTALNHTIIFSTVDGTSINETGYLKFDIAAQGSLYSIKAVTTEDAFVFEFSNIQQIEGDSVAEIPVYALYGLGFNEPEFNDSVAQNQLANIRFDFKSASIDNGVDDWGPGVDYNSGDLVKYGNKSWIALQDHYGLVPSLNPIYWDEVGLWSTNVPSLEYSGYQIKAAVLLFAGSSSQTNLAPLNSTPFVINTYGRKEQISAVEIFFKKSEDRPGTNDTPGTQPTGYDKLGPPSDQGGWVNNLPAKTAGETFWETKGHLWQIKGTISNEEGAYWKYGEPSRLDSLDAIELNLYYVQPLSELPLEGTALNNITPETEAKYYRMASSIDPSAGFSSSPNGVYGNVVTVQTSDGQISWRYEFDNNAATQQSRIYLIKATFTKAAEDDYFTISKINENSNGWSQPVLAMTAAKEVQFSNHDIQQVGSDGNFQFSVNEIPTTDSSKTVYSITARIPKGRDGDGTSGSNGVAPTYRGDYFEADGTTAIARSYIGKESGAENRGDIVKDNAAGQTVRYYICKQSHQASSPAYDTAPRNNPNLWEDFGEVFESVATSILLTEESYVTEKLEVGDVAKSGFILSNQFEGTAYSVGSRKMSNLLYFDPYLSSVKFDDVSRNLTPFARVDVNGFGKLKNYDDQILYTFADSDAVIGKSASNVPIITKPDGTIKELDHGEYRASFVDENGEVPDYMIGKKLKDTSVNTVLYEGNIYKIRTQTSGNDDFLAQPELYYGPKGTFGAQWWNMVYDKPSILSIKIKEIPHVGTLNQYKTNTYDGTHESIYLDLHNIPYDHLQGSTYTVNDSYYGSNVTAEYYYYNDSENWSQQGADFIEAGPFPCKVERFTVSAAGQNYEIVDNLSSINDWVSTQQYLAETRDPTTNVITRSPDIVFWNNKFWKALFRDSQQNPVPFSNIEPGVDSGWWNYWGEEHYDRVRIFMNQDEFSRVNNDSDTYRWDQGTVYQKNQFVWDTNGHRVFKSLVDNNVGNPIPTDFWNIHPYWSWASYRKALVIKVKKFNNVYISFDDVYDNQSIDINKDYSFFFSRVFERKVPFNYSQYDRDDWNSYMDDNGPLYDSLLDNGQWEQTNPDHVGIPIDTSRISSAEFAKRIWDANRDSDNPDPGQIGHRPNGSYSKFEAGVRNLYLCSSQFRTEGSYKGDNAFPVSTPVDYVNPGFQLIKDGDHTFLEIGATHKTEFISGYGEYSDENGKPQNRLTSSFSFDTVTNKIKIKGTFINNSTLNESILFEPNSDGKLIATSGWTNVDDFSSFIGGGYNNSFSVPGSLVSYANIASSIVGGAGNEILGRFSTIAGGYKGECKDNFSFIGGGYKNKMSLIESSEYPIWSSSAEYILHDIVSYNGNFYRSIKGSNQSETPSISPEYWAMITDVADHQGANFIGSGINNIIEGGSNQSILNGNNNFIKGRYGVYVPRYDNENSWTSRFIMGNGTDAVEFNTRWWDVFFGYLYTTDPVSSTGGGFLNSVMKGSWVYLVKKANQNWIEYSTKSNINYHPNGWIYLPASPGLIYLTEPVLGFWYWKPSAGQSADQGNWWFIFRGVPGAFGNNRGAYTIQDDQNIYAYRKL